MATSYRPPIGRFRQVEGRRLWLHRSGTVGPAVVILPGASAVGLDYLNVHDRVCAFTTSVLYDRGGTGWSDPVDLPRTAAEVAAELNRLLRAEGVPAPYVLVALSPQVVPEYVAVKNRALDDPDFRRLYMACDQALEWDADDPRLLELAGQIVAWASCRAEHGQATPGLVALVNSHIIASSPAWQRLGELLPAVQQKLSADTGNVAANP